MRKMNPPAFTPNEVFLRCVAAAPTLDQKQKYMQHQPNMAQAADDYTTYSQARNWCTLPRCRRGEPEQIVSGQLSKVELTDLYHKYMVGTTGPSRDIYDTLLVADGGKCPYCAGIGQIRTLDHYLPKSFFPLHSVNPYNLVPSCRDCNSGKNAAFPYNADGQGIHPYFDDPHFFDERWVFATVSPGSPVTVQFSARPPAHWSPIERSRASNHFTDNDLPLRYSIECGGVLGMIIGWRQGSLRRLSPQEFSEHLMEGANTTSFPLNGWKRTLYYGLATSQWFCSHAF